MDPGSKDYFPVTVEPHASDQVDALSTIPQDLTHSTISQDLTNRDALETNRLIALKEQKSFKSAVEDKKIQPDNDLDPWANAPLISFADQRSTVPFSKSKGDSSYVQEPGVTSLQRPSGSSRKKFRISGHSALSDHDPRRHSDDVVEHPRQSTAFREHVSVEKQASKEDLYKPKDSFSQSYRVKHDEFDQEETKLVRQLRLEIDSLRVEKQHLERRLQQPQARLQVVYRISRTERDHENSAPELKTDAYIDEPRWLKGDRDMNSLQGHLPITNMDSYIDRHPEISFIVFRDTFADHHKAEVEDEIEMLWKESIKITSPKLMQSVRNVMDQVSRSLNRDLHLGLMNLKTELRAPYLPFYHYRDMLSDFAATIPTTCYHEWRLLVEYIDQVYGDEYEQVENLLKAGTISRNFIPYLIKNGDVLICSDSGYESAYLAISEPTLPLSTDFQKLPNSDLEVSLFASPMEETAIDENLRIRGIRKEIKEHSDWSFENQQWLIRTQAWKFDGTFQKDTQDVSFNIAGGRNEILLIKDLEFYPIRYADPHLVSKLRERGLQLWKSRSRRYVSYRSEGSVDDAKSTDLRYMIDPATYKKLHKNDVHLKPLRDDLGPECMSAQEPPPDPFLLLLPSTINGFNMRNKKWEELEVARISDVHWNKEAFESLVVEPNTKMLIKALIMQQLEGEKGTDLIAGKGQGLIILLHGGPGTGKTFTAETVAEIAEKPLYRVTCGDLGTEPTAVEKYLDSVLHLGKIWDCVILLDEADVYLEERSMESLERNALVSVFLRVLEYYEGILILTSNRVGTFDESFKSRILLALHYQKLGLDDRHQIWENFIRRLRRVGEIGIDFDDIHKNIHDLARHELNGRQIRNAITTARQLARYQKKELDFSDLQQVIKIAVKFERYTTEMQGGRDDEEIKRDDGIRA